MLEVRDKERFLEMVLHALDCGPEAITNLVHKLAYLSDYAENNTQHHAMRDLVGRVGDYKEAIDKEEDSNQDLDKIYAEMVKSFQRVKNQDWLRNAKNSLTILTRDFAKHSMGFSIERTMPTRNDRPFLFGGLIYHESSNSWSTHT